MTSDPPAFQRYTQEPNTGLSSDVLAWYDSVFAKIAKYLHDEGIVEGDSPRVKELVLESKVGEPVRVKRVTYWVPEEEE